MKTITTLLPQTFYQKFLKEVRGIKFTPREIALLACFIRGLSLETMASFLAVSPKTVSAHTRNIMLKIKCNSYREIIDFVKNSKEHDSLNKYYSCLETNLLFKELLEELAATISTEYCTLVWSGHIPPPLLQQLTKDLRSVDVYTQIQRPSSISNNEKIFYIGFDNEIVIVENQPYSYYSAFFEILSRLYPDTNLLKFIKYFEHHVQRIEKDTGTVFQKIKQNRILPFQFTRSFFKVAGVLLLGLSVCAGFVIKSTFFQRPITQNQQLIHSDFIHSQRTALLKRPDLIQSIERKFQQQKGIRIVVLVGIGGSGKITLARLYAKSQKVSVTWEVNAGTKESLLRSYEDLARAMARTKKQKRKLRTIQDIQDPHKRENDLMSFIKKWLHANQNWLLIFSNIQNINEARKYLPLDQALWGDGKVIITTRNHNLKNNDIINTRQFVDVHPLSDGEKMHLFTQIVHGNNSSQITHSQKKDISNFLKNLPPFPLDVATAAYYIKDTQISYQSYMQRTKATSADFIIAQETLLKEATDYPRSRYGVVALTLEKLISEHKDFKFLLLLTSLLDSQNIPKSLLAHCTKSTTSEQFIHSLRRHSLISKEIPFEGGTIFSVHQGIHEVIYSYINRLPKLKNESINKIAKYINSYANKKLEKYEMRKIKNLLHHTLLLISHESLFNDIVIAKLFISLGRMYRELGHFQQAKSLFLRSLDIYNNYYAQNHPKMGWVYLCLGNIFMDLGLYDNAKEQLEKSLAIYGGKSFKTDIRTGWTLGSLGMTHKYMGRYNEAKNFLKKSHQIYLRNFKDDHVYIAWISGKLGNIYRTLGKYKKSKRYLDQSLLIYEKNYGKQHTKTAEILVALGNLYNNLGHFTLAKNLFQQSLTISQKHYGADHIKTTWVLIHLGCAFNKLSHYVKAKKILKEALRTLQTYYGQQHIRNAWVLLQLGISYSNIKNFEKANSFLKQSLKIYTEHYGAKHIKVAWVSNHLAEVHLKRNHLDTAEKLFKVSLKILKYNNHPRSIVVQENLAELYQKKEENILKLRKPNQIKHYRSKATKLLKTAHKNSKSYFAQNSPQTKRLKLKIKNMESNGSS